MLRAFTTRGVHLMKHAPAKVGVITKLEEERRLQTADVALRGILKIEIIIGDQPINIDQCRCGLSHVLDIDNGGANRQYEFTIIKNRREVTYQRMLSPASTGKSEED